jgi:AcrR family transcriptional regulator
MTDTLGAAKRKPRGEYAKSRAKRIAILDAALEVFAQSGYRSGSLREVAARVGMSEAGLLHHFPNKVKLLEGVLDRRDDLALSFIGLDAEDGAERLRGLVELAEYNASIPGVVELYCTLSAEATAPDHPAHGYFVRRYEYTRSMIGGAFQHLADTGRLVAGVDPARAAVTTISLWDGLQVQWLLDRSVLDMADQLRRYFDSLLAGGWPFPDEPRPPQSTPDTGADDAEGSAR